MASVTPHIYALVSARLDFFQMIVDVSEHAVHLAGAILVWIFVGGEIVGAERFAFLSFVAMRAADTERSGESLHHRLQPGAWPILWQDLKVFRFFRPSPFVLCTGGESPESG